jgi:hypothetical protein
MNGAYTAVGRIGLMASTVFDYSLSPSARDIGVTPAKDEDPYGDILSAMHHQ